MPCDWNELHLANRGGARKTGRRICQESVGSLGGQGNVEPQAAVEYRQGPVANIPRGIVVAWV
jgi:hypothetical protein